MDIDENIKDILNVLNTIKPEWTECAEPSSPIYNIAYAMAMIKPTINAMNIESENNKSLRTMDFNALLHSYGGAHNILYKGATQTKIQVKITSTSPLLLTKGTEVVDSANNVFLLDKDLSLIEGENITDFSCKETGNIIPSSKILSLLDNKDEISSIEVINISYYGTEAKTKEQYRRECIFSQKIVNNQSNGLILRLINNACCEKADVVFDKIDFIKPNSFAVLTYGGDEDLIFKEISLTNLVKEMCCEEETGKTKLILQGQDEVGNIKTAGSQILISYTPATLINYHLKIVLPYTSEINENQLKEFLVSRARENDIEYFRRKIFDTQFLSIIQEFFSKKNISIQIIDCMFSLTNNPDDYHYEIKPEKINYLLNLLSENIHIYYE